MSASVSQTTNLFPFLSAEEQHRDHQAEEALFLTFNVDLGYFEARLLGLVRATGARVTVLADANVWTPDVRAIKFAGRAYHLGLVDSPTAFHPKLMVVVGPRRAVAAVGSGNLTMGGWQYNHELLTVFTGDRDGMPVAFADLRDALDGLAAPLSLDPLTRRGLNRTTRHLDTLLAAAPKLETGHRVYASWDSPIIDHVPAEGVSELNLSAPFHDPRASAIGRLISQMEPRKVQVSVQPGWTHVHADVLNGRLTSYARETGATTALLEDPASRGTNEQRYRHGKLIEWVTSDGSRWALTGSPNLSGAALLKQAGDGGNYEIAVVGPVSETLFPGGRPVSPEGVPRLVVDDVLAVPRSDPQHAQVLSAISSEDRLVVRLSRPAPSTTTVELSLRNDHPDHWEVLGDFEEGALEATFDVVLPAGSRVRVNTAGRRPTAVAYVADELRVQSRSIPEAKTSKVRASAAQDLFGGDMRLLDLLLKDLSELAEEGSVSRLPSAVRERGAAGPQDSRDRARDQVQPWLWLQEDTVRKVGPQLASWLLALPHLARTDSGAVPWTDIITDDQVVGLDVDEEVDEVEEKLTEAEAESVKNEQVDHSEDALGLKDKRRRWARKAVAGAPEQSLRSRMLILRVLLVFWTAGNWDDDDPEPFTLTRDLIQSFGRPRTGELAEKSSALAATALTVMRQRTDVAVNNDRTVRYKQARDAAREVLTPVTEELLDGYVSGLRTAYGGVLTAGHVMDTLKILLDKDPLAAAEDVLTGKGYEVHRPGPSWMHIHRERGKAELSALEAVALAGDQDGVVVWSTTDKGDLACVAWQAPDLVTVFRGRSDGNWRHQKLPSRSGPGSAAYALKHAHGVQDIPHVVNTQPRHRRTPEAAAVLEILGVETWSEAPCCPDGVSVVEDEPSVEHIPGEEKSAHDAQSAPAAVPELRVGSPENRTSGPAVCPICWTQLPANGKCDNCP
ncbi:hypothetical protein ACQE98_02045 [Ornithinimicrobium sp. W1679]|uniref:hypothetical protein n=1 Tax=Ornithinimicrobium sp. W1679 TaxID=3418770 RepID=UPI003CE68B70